MLILAESAGQRAEIRDQFTSAGVGGDRIEFVGRSSRADYLRTFERIDIALDTLPYNGITTTCDALWMGVPVVSVLGPRHAGRAGKSVLSAAGFPEWAVETPEQFVATAVALASNHPFLKDLRSGMRQKVAGSSLADRVGFARNVESAYRWMWKRWCGNSVQLSIPALSKNFPR
jgi:predicted O-linked N-acetylglucosamine transferase (SPINDLY family)